MPPVDRNNPKRAKSSESTYTLMDLYSEFPDDATCLGYLWRRNYSPDGERAHCPKCKQERRFHKLKKHPAFSCDSCGHHIHPTAGTIFHKSSTSLVLWFHAVFLMSQTRCGISAKQLERELGVTYKTAWRMFNKIRSMLGQDDEPLSGQVEVDETAYGGKPRAYDSKGLTRSEAITKAKARKTTVLGMVERQGRVRVTIQPDRSEKVVDTIRQFVLPSALVFTDDWAGYRRLSETHPQHRRIRHTENIYVEGDLHTNTIEGFFGNVKSGIRGVYHSVSRKHLQSYLDEYAFRYNNRKSATPMFKLILARTSAVA